MKTLTRSEYSMARDKKGRLKAEDTILPKRTGVRSVIRAG